MEFQNKSQLKAVLAKEEKLYHKKWYYHLPIRFTEQQILYHHARLLRLAEYQFQHRKPFRHWYLFRLLRIQTRYAISIPLGVLDEGFEIAHLGSIIINGKAKIGKGARLHPGVCIGASHDCAPTIGDNVYFGPGAKIFGDVTLANNIRVGANAVVTKSCLEEGAVLVGAPAKTVKQHQEAASR